MQESNFGQWLKAAPVLLAAGEDEPYSSWLREAGAVVTRARSGVEASERIRDTKLRLWGALLDTTMPDSDWVALYDALPAHCALVVISGEADTKLLTEIRDRDAYFVSKAAPKADFMFAVGSALSVRGPSLTRLAARASYMWRLPPQQARLLYYNLWSYSDQEIADEMKLSVRTVQQYQEELRKRTGVRTKHAYMRRLLATAGAQPPLSMSDETLARLEIDKL
ncbi:MAG: hypothetical protein OXR73_03675 [Myxococcales bacterium]|nr:hypothetical protein [Myxococcales bacterium]